MSVCTILISAMLTIAGPAYVQERPVTSAKDKSELPRPRDGNIAIREELDEARRVRTLAAYDLFIARHPDHPLAEIARRERAALAARPRR